MRNKKAISESGRNRVKPAFHALGPNRRLKDAPTCSPTEETEVEAGFLPQNIRANDLRDESDIGYSPLVPRNPPSLRCGPDGVWNLTPRELCPILIAYYRAVRW